LTRYQNTRLLTPPRKEEEIYPYRRVWPSITIEVGGVFAAAISLYILNAFLGFAIPSPLRLPANITLALLPAILWIFASRWRERTALEPRRGLLSVAVISALVANAIGIPIINALSPDDWLSLSGTFNRILGYAVTTGIIHEILKYLVLRYTAWPDHYRNRLDSIAYSMAAATGYVTVLNLQLVLGESLAPEVVAMRVFSNTAAQVAAGFLVAYGLSEVRFNPRSFLLMPFTMMAAALIHGLTIASRAGLVNGSFFLGIGGTRPLFGLLFSLIVVVGALLVIAFLFNNADRREREAIASAEIS